jgi:hypothetical protein
MIVKRFESENKIKYNQVFLKTYKDIVENDYNLSILKYMYGCSK